MADEGGGHVAEGGGAVGWYSVLRYHYRVAFFVFGNGVWSWNCGGCGKGGGWVWEWIWERESERHRRGSERERHTKEKNIIRSSRRRESLHAIRVLSQRCVIVLSRGDGRAGNGGAFAREEWHVRSVRDSRRDKVGE